MSRNIGWCAQGRHSTANAIINIALSPRVLDSTVIVSRCGSGGETVARDRGALSGGATSLIVLACTSIKCFECPSGIVYLWLEVWVILFKNVLFDFMEPTRSSVFAIRTGTLKVDVSIPVIVIQCTCKSKGWRSRFFVWRIRTYRVNPFLAVGGVVLSCQGACTIQCRDAIA